MEPRSAWHILRTSSDLALYLEDYLIYEHNSSWLWVSTTRRLTSKQTYVTVIYISWSIDFGLYLEDYLMYEQILWDHESVWPNVGPQKKCRSQWPIYHGPLILPYILKTVFNVWTSLFGILSQYDLKINVGHCDLYFMVQWFCPIFPRLFDGWVSYFR